jgi:cellulose synthase/poly-beta-1,6-N-acetylglucosamine synthase-like glycosyltransferase
VVIADNCSDRTADIARTYPVTVHETVGNRHRKSGALNQAWRLFEVAERYDLLVGMDADTTLPPDALERWERELADHADVGGVSAKFTMLPADGDSRWQRLLVRMQKAEFSRWTDQALRRKGRWTSVLAGTACCMRVSALAQIASSRAGEGPWTYDSLVEDFELTYRLREHGYRCCVSADVRAYTDAMRGLRSLWAQRMKWQTGTASDLLRFGLNRRTLMDWWQQGQGLLSSLVRLAWVACTGLAVALHSFSFHLVWLLPVLVFAANDVRQSLRVPHRERADLLLAAVLVPQELMAWLRGAWFLASWCDVVRSRISGRQRDRWALQYSAEAAKGVN